MSTTSARMGLMLPESVPADAAPTRASGAAVAVIVRRCSWMRSMNEGLAVSVAMNLYLSIEIFKPSLYFTSENFSHFKKIPGMRGKGLIPGNEKK